MKIAGIVLAVFLSGWTATWGVGPSGKDLTIFYSDNLSDKEWILDLCLAKLDWGGGGLTTEDLGNILQMLETGDPLCSPDEARTLLRGLSPLVYDATTLQAIVPIERAGRILGRCGHTRYYGSSLYNIIYRKKLRLMQVAQ